MSVAYEVVIIGVEVHAQLRTQSKLFCSGVEPRLAAPYNSADLSSLSWVAPGSLPVINEKAVEMAVRAGLAMNGRSGCGNRFARKNYFTRICPRVIKFPTKRRSASTDGLRLLRVGLANVCVSGGPIWKRRRKNA